MASFTPFHSYNVFVSDLDTKPQYISGNTKYFTYFPSLWRVDTFSIFPAYSVFL